MSLCRLTSGFAKCQVIACVALGTNVLIFSLSSLRYSSRVNEKPKSPSTFRCALANASCCASAFRMVSPISKNKIVINGRLSQNDLRVCIVP